MPKKVRCCNATESPLRRMPWLLLLHLLNYLTARELAMLAKTGRWGAGASDHAMGSPGRKMHFHRGLPWWVPCANIPSSLKVLHFLEWTGNAMLAMQCARADGESVDDRYVTIVLLVAQYHTQRRPLTRYFWEEAAVARKSVTS